MLTKCRQPGCQNRFNAQTGHSPWCPKCRARRFRDKWPLKAAYAQLRTHAKSRSKPFTLTYDQFEAFAVKTDYARLRGKSSLSLSIDRIENSLGYHWWNIQAITIRENCRKEFVPYFQQQGLTRSEKSKADALERAYSARLEALADQLSRSGLKPGSPAFFKQFTQLKAVLLQ